jgi:release factor glutamine methyltransferase
MRTAVAAREALEGALTAFAAAGIDTPRLDAELLLADALGVTRTRLHLDPELPVTGEAVRAFQSFVRRRSVEREPVAYILGRRGFWDVELRVDARALIPRPETELLVERAAELAPEGARVLDVGTGTGAVAIALARARPDLEVWGTDLSEAALGLAAENVAATGAPVSLVRSDLLAGAPGPWDVVVSNPPYIRSEDLPTLAPEITRHEPASALDGGPDGLRVIARLAEETRGLALVLIEIGAGQADAVAALLTGARVSRHRDLAGIERVLAAER